MQVQICTYIPSHIWLNVHQHVEPQPDAFCSNQQASGIILIGYLTTLLGRISRIHLSVVHKFSVELRPYYPFQTIFALHHTFSSFTISRRVNAECLQTSRRLTTVLISR